MIEKDLGLNLGQIRQLVVRPALQSIDAWSLAAENLVIGTGITESRLKAIKQYGTGPALGIFQMEPFTHDDIWRTHLLGKPRGVKVGNLVRYSEAIPPAENLIWNLRYAAAMCRCHYLRIRQPLPAPNDAHGMARYWKQYYNTHLGAGTVEKALPAFELAVETSDAAQV